MKLSGTMLTILMIASCRQHQAENIHWISDSNSLAAAIEMYRLNTGEIPTNEEGLYALRERPVSLPQDKGWKRLTDHVFADAWGNPYHYKVIPNTDPPQFEIRSFGPDMRSSADDLIETFSTAVVVGSLRAEMQPIEFDARIAEIKLSRQFNAGTIITGIDPRFSVSMVLMEDVEGLGMSGQTVSFAIHSPARDLHFTDQQAAIGQQFRFEISSSKDSDRKLLHRITINKNAN